MAAESKKAKDPCRLTLRNVRLSYPNLFTARAFARGEGKPAFSATALIDKNSKAGKALIDKIYDAIDAAKEKKWPGKTVKIKKANMAIADGDEVNEEEEDVKPEQEGMFIVRARNYKRPQTLDENNEEVREQDNVLYGGCFVDMMVTFWAQDYENTKRVNCSLEIVRFRDEGEPFGAGPIDPSEMDDDDDDDRGSRRSSSKGRSRDDDDDDRGSRSSKRRGRDDDEDDDDRSSRSSRRSRDEDDDDDRGSRSSRRGRDDDEDDRPARSSRRGRDDDEEERPSRSSRRGRDDDDEDRGSRRSRRRDDDLA